MALHLILEEKQIFQKQVIEVIRHGILICKLIIS